MLIMRRTRRKRRINEEEKERKRTHCIARFLRLLRSSYCCEIGYISLGTRKVRSGQEVTEFWILRIFKVFPAGVNPFKGIVIMIYMLLPEEGYSDGIATYYFVTFNFCFKFYHIIMLPQQL